MFPNSYFTPTYFTPGYFTVLGVIVILPQFIPVDTGASESERPEDYTKQWMDDEEVLEMITYLFQLGVFDV